MEIGIFCMKRVRSNIRRSAFLVMWLVSGCAGPLLSDPTASTDVTVPSQSDQNVSDYVPSMQTQSARRRDAGSQALAQPAATYRGGE